MRRAGQHFTCPALPASRMGCKRVRPQGSATGRQAGDCCTRLSLRLAEMDSLHYTGRERVGAQKCDSRWGRRRSHRGECISMYWIRGREQHIALIQKVPVALGGDVDGPCRCTQWCTMCGIPYHYFHPLPFRVHVIEHGHVHSTMSTPSRNASSGNVQRAASAVHT